MKFLVLALCVCAASAAFEPYKPFQPVTRQPYQQFGNFRQPAAAPSVVAQSAYGAAKFVAAAPAVAAKATYDTARFVAAAPIAAAKATYDAAKFVASPVVTEVPIIDAKSVYTAPQVVEVAPVVTKPVYEAVQVVASPPVVAAKSVYGGVAAAPRTAYTAGKEAEAAILRSEADVSADSYNFVYETSNGIAAQSSGSLKAVGGEPALVSEGFYQYYAPDGTLVKFEYTADENGYQPRSDLLPVAPPVPVLIARSLEYIRAHPSKNVEY